MNAVMPFSLSDVSGERHVFSGDGQSLVCFIKEDCPTCREVMPLLDALQNYLDEKLEFHVLGQTQEGNAILEREFTPAFSIVDDSELKVSFETDIETVPALIWSDGTGSQKELIGFDRSEWQQLITTISSFNALQENEIEWSAFPEWRPGCGSLSVDPIHADRLRAESENSPIRARKIEIGVQDDEFEFMFDQGFSDGLPVIPPTAERVVRMLAGTSRDPQDVVAVMPPNMGEVTVEKIAINCVLAGCKPEYMPVVIAAVEAIATDDYNIHGVMATTMGASPVLVVNGPIRKKIGMNMGIGALGQGNRANATIGRAVRLVVRNVGGAIPGGTERSTLGNPMKFTMCFAEWEERSNWDPLHVERGFEPEDSVVTAFTMSSGPVLTTDESSLHGDLLAGTIAQCVQTILAPKAYGVTDCLIVVSPEHVDTFSRDEYQKADIRRRIQSVTQRTYREMIVDNISGSGLKPEIAAKMDEETLNKVVTKFGSDSNIHIVVAGSEAGKFSGCFHGWLTGPKGSIPVSRKIDER